MLQRIIRPHDHIRTILRLRIHPALNCQSPPIRTIQQIPRNGSRPNIKRCQTPPTSFLPHFQNPPNSILLPEIINRQFFSCYHMIEHQNS